MTREEWKDYKDFDVLSREMIGGYSAADLYNANMMHLNAASFLGPMDLTRVQSSASTALHEAEGTIGSEGSGGFAAGTMSVPGKSGKTGNARNTATFTEGVPTNAPGDSAANRPRAE